VPTEILVNLSVLRSSLSVQQSFIIRVSALISFQLPCLSLVSTFGRSEKEMFILATEITQKKKCSTSISNYN